MSALSGRGYPPKIDPALGPVVVGGVGGSGTRVVAEIMRHLGVYTGCVLNKAGDNKWFSLLCKLPRFSLDPSSRDSELFYRALDLLERAMTGQVGPDRADRRLINQLIDRWAKMKREHPLPDDRSVEWVRGHAASLKVSREQCPDGAPMWGWKEPNSHLFLPHMERHFGDRLRYVHVIRNGIYMAYSDNQAQAMRWGPEFGLGERAVHGQRVPRPTPPESLDYWIASNERAVSRGGTMPEGSFYLMNHDDLCANPRDGVTRFVEFLGFTPSAEEMEFLISLPEPPKSAGLSLSEMREQFGDERLARVTDLGFRLEGAA
jgi:hypothetical protein